MYVLLKLLKKELVDTVKKSMLSIGLGCEAKYTKDFVYTENLDLNDKKSEIPIGVSCRTCDN